MSDTTYVLSDEDIATINATRTVLEKRFGYPTQKDAVDGMLYAVARGAADGLFDLLNWYASYGNAAITDEQVHNRPLDPVA